jgi:hypothetical protein
MIRRKSIFNRNLICLTLSLCKGEGVSKAVLKVLSLGEDLGEAIYPPLITI